MSKTEHTQSSAFFAENKNYLRFEDYLALNNIDSRHVPFTELSYKVCGYGYFDKYKENMKQHFREYLWHSIQASTQLNTLKIVFNGFIVNSSQQQVEQAQELKMPQDHIFLNILQSIQAIVHKRKIKVLHLHTTNLRNCTENDLVRLFNLVCLLGETSCQEISIQLADWEFEGGYPQYNKLVEIFTNFVMTKPATLNFKKFRLEMSSWYMKEKEAYKFLSKTLTNEQMIEKFKKEQKAPPVEVKKEKQGENTEGQEQENIMDVVFPHLPVQEREQTMNALVYFLENVDARYYQPKYPYKQTHELYNQQDFNTHSVMIEETKRCEQIISKRLVKYPNEFVMQLRVEEYHRKMVQFLSNLLIKLNVLQEYHIDMRGWNGLFSMSGLKKTLDTKVISNKQEFSLIRKSLITNKNQGAVSDEVGLKTIYTM